MPPTITRRQLLKALGIGTASGAVSACAGVSLPLAAQSTAPAIQAEPTAAPAAPTAAPATAEPTPQAVAEVVPQPAPAPQTTLAQKIGQMLLVGFRGFALDPTNPVVADVQQYNLGGVMLSDYDGLNRTWGMNISSAEQVQALVRDLQSLASTPLLVAIDQEGGQVMRLKTSYGFPPNASHANLGQTNNLAYTREQASIIASTLAHLGINLNFAPVVDVNINPNNPIIASYERSFSADPSLVLAHALAYILAHHANGVGCTLKHFPGHGSSTGDSHEDWVDVTATWGWQELEPYRALIGAGVVDAIMTAHIYNANFDVNDPATLSPATINGLLREQLGYDGVVISDDLQMAAITRYYGYDLAIQKAILAGVDMLLIANNAMYAADTVPRTVALIEGMVAQGVIPAERIEQSYERIQRMKAGLI